MFNIYNQKKYLLRKYHLLFSPQKGQKSVVFKLLVQELSGRSCFSSCIYIVIRSRSRIVWNMMSNTMCPCSRMPICIPLQCLGVATDGLGHQSELLLRRLAAMVGSECQPIWRRRLRQYDAFKWKDDWQQKELKRGKTGQMRKWNLGIPKKKGDGDVR